MKFARAFFTLLPMASALPLADKTSSDTSTANIEAETDYLLFDVSLPEFLAHRQADEPPDLDWSSDSCTDSPNNPFGFHFDPACKRHDFGYRNYKLQDRFDDDHKNKIDQNFKADLYYQCSQVKDQSNCAIVADVYYFAVEDFAHR